MLKELVYALVLIFKKTLYTAQQTTFRNRNKWLPYNKICNK